MKPLPQIADFPIPYCRETELALLAEIVSAPEHFPLAQGQILPEFFFNALNKQIWLTITDMADKHESLRFETIVPRVDRDYFLHEVMGSDIRGTYSSIQALIDGLRETYIKRKAYYVAVEALTKIEKGCDAGLVQEMYDDFSESVAKGLNDGKFSTTIEVGNELAEDLRECNGVKIPTMMGKVDWYTYGGFGAGELIILAARPGVGKTTIALQWALNMSANEKVVYFSLEMTKKELLRRMMMGTEMITPYQLAQGGVDWQAYDNALGKVANNNFRINDTSCSLNDICSKIAMAVQEKKCDIAFIDYLGLIEIEAKRGMTQAQVIGEATRKLKNLAKNCRIPIVLLCQMNRQVVNEGRAPRLSDLRDSGNIEQDADKVVMLENVSENENENKINLWIRKCRNGKLNTDNPIVLEGNQYYSNFREL